MRACVRGSPARVCARSEVAKLTSSMTVEQMQARLAQLQAEVRGVGLTAGRAVGRALMFGAGSLWRRFTERAQRHAAQGAAGGWQHDLARGREKDQCRVRVQRQDVASAQAQGRSADKVPWGTSSSTGCSRQTRERWVGGAGLQCKEILDMIMENSPLKPKDLMVPYDPMLPPRPFPPKCLTHRSVDRCSCRRRLGLRPTRTPASSCRPPKRPTLNRPLRALNGRPRARSYLGARTCQETPRYVLLFVNPLCI